MKLKSYSFLVKISRFLSSTSKLQILQKLPTLTFSSLGEVVVEFLKNSKRFLTKSIRYTDQLFWYPIRKILQIN